MKKTPARLPRARLLVVLSGQSAELLERLAAYGIYGASPEEVAERFIDEGIQRFVETPRLRARKTGCGRG